MNFKLLIQYDGTDFHGWQVQGKQRTVQGELEKIIGKLENAEVKVIGSGRTDTGVHAEAQVANIHLNREWTPEKLRLAINGNIRQDVRILQVEEVPDDFHARFSARGKSYIYRVVNAPVISPFWARYAHHEMRPLDAARMNEAARLFLGEHDWTAFSSAKSDARTRIRTIQKFTVESHWETRAAAFAIEFRITGSGFLRYMVRSIVGTLLEVGRGEKDFDTIQTAIETGDRNLAGKTASARGLTLLKIHYE
ncbi:MAG: tRNA pseudouridine(38-40) synthase TruA [Pyrinomonadaceae bacterium]